MPLSLESFDRALGAYFEPQAFDDVLMATGIRPTLLANWMPPWVPLELDEVDERLRELAFRHQSRVRVQYAPVLFPRLARLERATVQLKEWGEDCRYWWGRRPRFPRL